MEDWLSPGKTADTEGHRLSQRADLVVLKRDSTGQGAVAALMGMNINPE